jgi:hypothetical protein
MLGRYDGTLRPEGKIQDLQNREIRLQIQVVNSGEGLDVQDRPQLRHLELHMSRHGRRCVVDRSSALLGC